MKNMFLVCRDFAKNWFFFFFPWLSAVSFSNGYIFAPWHFIHSMALSTSAFYVLREDYVSCFLPAVFFLKSDIVSLKFPLPICFWFFFFLINSWEWKIIAKLHWRRNVLMFSAWRKKNWFTVKIYVLWTVNIDVLIFGQTYLDTSIFLKL